MLRTGDVAKVEAAITNRRLLTITTCADPAGERDAIHEILARFLEAAGRGALYDRVSYCIHELASNARRANTKRVYFREKRLDIHRETDYWVGMRTFRDETSRRSDHYAEALRHSGLTIKVQFRLGEEALRVAVRNNVRLTSFEREKMEEKIARGRRYDSTADAYAGIEESSEGAGLGIAMMIIMLRDQDACGSTIRFFANDRETYAIISIPTPGSGRD